MKSIKLIDLLWPIIFNCCSNSKENVFKNDNNVANAINTVKFVSINPATNIRASQSNFQDQEVEKVKQQIWTNLSKVPGTTKDYTTTVTLRIADGNILDADCRVIFPESSWLIASVLLDDYKDVLKNTSNRIFEVIYKLISDPNTLTSEIRINGLWRPWGGSHVHVQGRGMDIGTLRSANGDGCIFNVTTSANENSYATRVRNALTNNFSAVNQYLSPWFICSPVSRCVVNNGVSALERIHRDHLHLTLNP